MGQMFGGMWDRARGKWHLERICNKIFAEFSDKDGNMPLNDLHCATLMVYISANKQFLSPYKEPPSKETVEAKVKELEPKKTIDRKTFLQLIMEWMHKDMQIMLINRFVLALLAAPGMGIMTKNAAKRLPRVQHVVEKVPTPVFICAYSVALVLLQDVRMN